MEAMQPFAFFGLEPDGSEGGGVWRWRWDGLKRGREEDVFAGLAMHAAYRTDPCGTETKGAAG